MACRLYLHFPDISLILCVCLPLPFFSLFVSPPYHELVNSLDVDTIRSMEEALLEFAGCAVVVSHDRFFLDRICTHILAYEGDSNVRFFVGNYNEYETWFRESSGVTQPKPITYAPLANVQ